MGKNQEKGSSKKSGEMIIGITGGKGGTGKTVFAVNLAVALAKQGKEVTYLDCDPDCPSAHILLNANLENRRIVRSFLPKFIDEKCMRCGKCVDTCQFNSLYQLKGKLPRLMEGLCAGCKACLLACPFHAIEEKSKVIGWTYRTRKFGIELFSGMLRPSEPLSEKIVEEVKKRGFKEGSGEIFIVDSAAGAHCPVLRALEGCHKAIAITEPTLFGQHDLTVIKNVLERLGIPYEVVVNRSTISKRKIKGAVLEIPYHRDMIDCYVEGVPIVEKKPDHRISKMLSDFSRRMMK